MDIAGNSYKNNASGVVVKVIDTFDNIAILENRQKMDVRELTNPELYTEELDVNSFINNSVAYNILADKIRNIPTEFIGDDDGEVVRVNTGDSDTIIPQSNESLIINTNEDYERELLAKKYGVVDNREGINKQNEAFEKLLNPDAETPEIDTPVYQPKEYQAEEQVQRIDVSRDGSDSNREYQEYIHQPVPVHEDPVIKMFRGIKRSVDFNITIDLENKIPRIDFIEMMEDSYESSIIDFLADELTQSIISNPDNIKNMIKDKIKQIVYEKEPKVKTRKTPVKKQTTVDPVKSKRTYKPREKKEKREEV
jgi:hypothetical protein